LQLTPSKFGLEIILIVIQESLLLDEIAEHQAIKHNGGVPLLVSVIFVRHAIIDARDEVAESFMLLLEARIEIFG
jgi:hypothetical protein